MKAYIFENSESGQKPYDLKFIETNTPTIDYSRDTDSIIIKVKQCSICRTDVSNYRKELGEEVNGKTPGHEVRGEVVARGPNAPLKIGDHIVYYGATDFGGLAEFKKIEQVVLPDTENPRIFYSDGQFYDCCGAAVLQVNKREMEKESTLLEPLTCVLRYLNSYPPLVDGTAFVAGAGPVGIIAMQCMKKIFGTRRVIVLDINEQRLERAKQFGADDVINLNNEKDRKVFTNWAQDVADYGFEALSPKHSDSIDVRQYLSMLMKPKGTYVLFGAESREEATDLKWLLSKDLKLAKVSFDVTVFPMQKSASIMRQAKSVVECRLINLIDMVDEEVNFNNEVEVRRVFDSYGLGRTLKTVITFD